MYYILHGEDEFSRTEEVNKMRAKMGDPQLADLSIAVFDGRKVSLGELQHACDALPFLSDKRLVIVEGMLTRLEGRRKKEGPLSSPGENPEPAEEPVNPELASGLKEYLTRLPESTRLVFVEAKTLAKNNPVLKHAESDRRHGHVKEFPVPKQSALPRWIQARVVERGGAIDPEAVQELAAYTGSDLRLLDNEIQKLLTFCGPEPIHAADVRTLVAPVRESVIFDLVDAIGERQTSTALKLLHAQLDQNAAPLYLLSMITRQFRMLLQILDLQARGLNSAGIREQLKLHPFVLEKTCAQAANFELSQLRETYDRLLETDLAIKTSRMDPVVALDMLVIDLTQN